MGRHLAVPLVIILEQESGIRSFIASSLRGKAICESEWPSDDGRKQEDKHVLIRWNFLQRTDVPFGGICRLPREEIHGTDDSEPDLGSHCSDFEF